MRYRKLRIAWSVGCGIVAVLLIVLWVRSYFWMDAVRTTNHSATSFLGRLMIDTQYVLESLSNEFPPGLNNQIGGSSLPVNAIDITPLDRSGVTIPFWAPILVFATFASVPWLGKLRWRFRLRTLLIATTLVAVGLGLIVAMVR